MTNVLLFINELNVYVGFYSTVVHALLCYSCMERGSFYYFFFIYDFINTRRSNRDIVVRPLDCYAGVLGSIPTVDYIVFKRPLPVTRQR